MDRNIIFVGGIHGVGKGTICKKLADNSDFEHLSASEVLKWNEISDLKNKKVQNFATTQDRLISNLNKITKSDKKYLLDGHFALLNSTGQPEKIDDSTFEAINLISIILLTCEPKLIYERLKKRDDSIYNLDILKEMQEIEIEHANHISQKLQIPLFNIVDGKTNSIIEYLNIYGNIN